MRAGVYIHVPFCARKCLYCDFYSLPREGEDVDAFVAAVAAEMALAAEAHADLAPFDVPTIFLGGGTPSLLSPEQLGRILEAVCAHFQVAPDAEFTLEANPESVSPAKARVYRELGVNRVSLGVQSFDDALLARIGRIHSSDRAERAFADLRAAGFDNLSLDLMFALPDQSPEQWRETLARAIDLRPEHVSAYSLIVEDGTPFAEWQRAGRLPEGDDDRDAAMFETGIAMLTAAGYEHYEVSNFALPGRRCAHNEIYWRNEPYFGFGPSAAGYLGGVRAVNVRSLPAYLAAVAAGNLPVESFEAPGPALEMGETMMVGLRLLEGVERARFRRRFGADLCDVYAGPIARLTAAGLLVVDDRRLALTHRGLLFANDVVAELLPAE